MRCLVHRIYHHQRMRHSSSKTTSVPLHLSKAKYQYLSSYCIIACPIVHRSPIWPVTRLLVEYLRSATSSNTHVHLTTAEIEIRIEIEIETPKARFASSRHSTRPVPTDSRLFGLLCYSNHHLSAVYARRAPCLHFLRLGHPIPLLSTLRSWLVLLLILLCPLSRHPFDSRTFASIVPFSLSSSSFPVFPLARLCNVPAFSSSFPRFSIPRFLACISALYTYPRAISCQHYGPQTRPNPIQPNST